MKVAVANVGGDLNVVCAAIVAVVVVVLVVIVAEFASAGFKDESGDGGAETVTDDTGTAGESIESVEDDDAPPNKAVETMLALAVARAVADDACVREAAARR